MNSRKAKGKYPIALGGILGALTVVFIYIASFVPGVELTMFAISSVFVAIMLIEAGPRASLLVFLVATIIGFIIIPNKIAIVPYLLIFGHYGIEKYYIEKLNNLALELILKGALFLIAFGIGYLLLGEVFFGNIELPNYPLPVLAVGGVVLFLIYDRVYSAMIMFYLNNVRHKIRNV